MGSAVLFLQFQFSSLNLSISEFLDLLDECVRERERERDREREKRIGIEETAQLNP